MKLTNLPRTSESYLRTLIPKVTCLFNADSNYTTEISLSNASDDEQMHQKTYRISNKCLMAKLSRQS